MRKHLWIAVATILGIFSLVGVAGRAAFAGPPAQTANGMDQLAKLSGREFEIAFMSMMIPHHMAAVDMAKLVPARAQHAELKTTAQNISSSQSSEIAKMTGWLQTWYGTVPQAQWAQGMQQDMAAMGMTADMQKLATLQGAAFDQQFLLSMTPHHTMAVTMAQLVATRATHAELKTLAQDIISSQSAEIGQFTSWLKAWYNQAMPSSMAGGNMGNMGGMAPTATTGPMAGAMATVTPDTMAGGLATATPGTMGQAGSGTLPVTGQPPLLPFWLLCAGFAMLLLVVGALWRAQDRRLG